jgi:hypothetical protein
MQHEIKIPQQIIDAGITKEINPAQQWDQLAFTLMYQELAPKGFKKFTNGHWRGLEHADIPFLSKKTVQKCQKISAQLVRGFRDKAKKDLNVQIEEAKKNLSALRWYHFRARWEAKAVIETLNEVVKWIDKVSVK